MQSVVVIAFWEYHIRFKKTSLIQLREIKGRPRVTCKCNGAIDQQGKDERDKLVHAGVRIDQIYIHTLHNSLSI